MKFFKTMLMSSIARSEKMLESSLPKTLRCSNNYTRDKSHLQPNGEMSKKFSKDLKFGQSPSQLINLPPMKSL